jgi:thioredoxin-related protein
MNKLFFAVIIMFMVSTAAAQDMKAFKLYNPYENVDSALQVVYKKAAAQNKQVFIQIGGNWCVWCARYNEFVTKDTQIDSLVNANYIVYHLNYSPENKNSKTLAKLGFPQRFGFPVFIILDAKGNRLHTQNSAYLEKEKSYNKALVMEFYKHWTKTALDPAQYKND